MKWSLNRTIFLLLCGHHLHGVMGDYAVPIPGENVCPKSCQVSESGSRNWTTYSSMERLSFCNETMLLDFAVHNPLGDSSKAHTIKACMVSSSPQSRGRTRYQRSQLTTRSKNGTTLPVEVAWSDSKGPVDMVNAVTGMKGAQDWIESDKSTSVLFTHRGDTAVGIWTGALVIDDVQDAGLIDKFIERLNRDKATEIMVIQACNQEYGADYSFGMAAAMGASPLQVVQDIVKSWTNSSYVAGIDKTSALDSISLSSTPPAIDECTAPSRLASRATCKSIKAGDGDSCASLAKKCGISLADFQKYNPGSSFCSSLQPTQPVCCSAGELPKPQPSQDETCATYTVQGGDWCAKIAAANAVTTRVGSDWLRLKQQALNSKEGRGNSWC
ncbi:hypothetical protein BGZ63DRAFT_401934 [Mariannaea sp. PMI_226]|nr:hypothetical protein BGZ63DRAFT_401934 [Mariannaea sp. PMI_226]